MSRSIENLGSGVVRRVGGLEDGTDGRAEPATVVRRVGGLEVNRHIFHGDGSVVRRVGGLEGVGIEILALG